MIMICDNCKTERQDNDFIYNQKFCYHCEYRIKLEKSLENHITKKFNCRTCGKEFFKLKDLKKRQRDVYCSPKCALDGHKKQNDDHWTKHVRARMVDGL